MTGFLGKTKARTFIGDLWDTLVQAQESPHGIPVELIELKRSQLIKKKVINCFQTINNYHNNFNPAAINS